LKLLREKKSMDPKGRRKEEGERRGIPIPFSISSGEA